MNRLQNQSQQQEQMQMQQQQQQQQQMNSGLTRYRSAPSSYFTSLLSNTSIGSALGENDFDQLFYPRSTSPETQRIFAKFMNSVEPIEQNTSSNVGIQQSHSQSHDLVQPVKIEQEIQQLQRQQSSDYPSVSQMMYQSGAEQSHHIPEAANSSVDNSYGRLVGSINPDRVPQMKMGGGNTNLIRHSSSPAGLFANIDIENEFGIGRGMGDFGAGNSANMEGSFSFASRFRRQVDFQSRHPSSSGMMAPISEHGSKGIGDTKPNDGQFENNRGNDSYMTNFPISSWDDPSSMLSDSFLEGLGDNENKTFSNLNANNQNTESQSRPTTLLSHHLSLPKSSGGMSAMEKLLQDSVPCKIRAKRGFATHPRSIAERVRRSKISERMRKLQDLVPNMEKQTNTADMLDLAVDYIKELQKQVKALSDNRAKCTCSNKQKK